MQDRNKKKLSAIDKIKKRHESCVFIENPKHVVPKVDKFDKNITTNNVIKSPTTIVLTDIVDKKEKQNEVLINKNDNLKKTIINDEKKMNERDLRRIYGKDYDSVKNKKYIPVSIIITAYNSDMFIESCLDSIVNQTYFVNNDNYEILLGIDGCEKTFNKILNISYKYKKLKIYMMNSNMGTYVTTNTLIDLCSFDKIIRFDSDDVMCDNMIEKLVGYNEYDIVRFMYYTFTDTIADSYIKNNRYPHGVALFNKIVFNKAGGYQDWICAADTELLERVKNHFNIKLINERLFHRRIHENSLTKRKDVGFFSDVRNQYEAQIREFDSTENIYIAKKKIYFQNINMTII